MGVPVHGAPGALQRGYLDVACTGHASVMPENATRHASVMPENATRTDTLPLRGATSSGAGGRYATGGSVQAADQFAWAVSGLARAIIKTLTHIKCGGTRSGRRFASARRVGRPPAGLPQRRVHWGALPRQPHARGTVCKRCVDGCVCLGRCLSAPCRAAEPQARYKVFAARSTYDYRHLPMGLGDAYGQRARGGTV